MHKTRFGSSAVAAKTTLCSLALLVCAALLPMPAPAEDAGPAIVRLRDFYSVLQQTMMDASHLQVKARYEKLAPAVRATFDLGAMTRIAIGPEWASIPVAQQAQLVDEFSRMTIATYASRFDGYDGEHFEVDPNTVERSGKQIVHSRLMRPRQEPVPLNYLFHATGAGWKAIDVYLSGTISELATRRSEFTAILKSKGADALIDNLRERANKLIAG